MAGIDYLIGVDGGGTKTLVRLANRHGDILAQASGPGSALRNGADNAWRVINDTIADAFAEAALALPPAAHLALGIGIAGHNVTQWAEAFRAAAPTFGALEIVSDGVISLLGAHAGQAGAIIAVGTGTIGLALDVDGAQRVVDGWGFPTGDDGSGAWIGMRAVHHVQHALDGRAIRGALTEALLALCAQETPAAGLHDERELLLAWLAQANQAAFARVARPVVEQAGHDAAARAILQAAAAELGSMAQALDPGQRLPLALSGGLATVLLAYLDPALRQRIVPAQSDAAAGALLLARRVAPSLTETTS